MIYPKISAQSAFQSMPAPVVNASIIWSNQLFSQCCLTCAPTGRTSLKDVKTAPAFQPIR
mgnify:CR=1 FL=1